MKNLKITKTKNQIGKQAQKDRKIIRKITENKRLWAFSKNAQDKILESIPEDTNDWKEMIIEVFAGQYYLISPITQKNSSDLMFIEKDKKSGFDVKGYEYHQQKFEDTQIFENGTFIISLETLHSFEAKQGHGKNIVEQLKTFSEKKGIPLSLWCETQEAIRYFENLGFKLVNKNESTGKFALIFNPEK